MRHTLPIVLFAALALSLAGCGSSPDMASATGASLMPLPGPAWSRALPGNRQATPTAALELADAQTESGWAVGTTLWSDGTVSLLPPQRQEGFWSVTPPSAVGNARPLTTEWLHYTPPTAANGPVVTSRAAARRLGRDVYLVHGLLSSGRAMQNLASLLEELDLYDRVIVCTYRDERPIRESARDLAEFIQANTSKDVGCDIIAHSLGGLVSRWAVEQLNLRDRVRAVWMLGTPHLGSTLATAMVRLPLEEWLDGSATGVAISFAVNAGGHLAVLGDLASDSDFIRQLSWGPRLVGAPYDYLTLGGDLIVKGRRTYSDGVVGLANATWSGLGLRARSHTPAIVPVSHGGLIRDERSLKQLAAMLRVRAARQ